MLLSLTVACGQGMPPPKEGGKGFITTTQLVVDPGGGGSTYTQVTTQMLHPVTNATVLQLSVDSDGNATWSHPASGLTGSLQLNGDLTGGDVQTAAKMIFGQVQKVFEGANFDSFGCDIPKPFTPLTCGNQGACCDDHDYCYYQNGCTAKSWEDLPFTTACSRCNMAAVGCILSAAPGPSACCNMTNAYGGPLCGTPRCPGMWGFADYPTCGGLGSGGTEGTGTGTGTGTTGGSGGTGTGPAGGSGGSSCDGAGLWSDGECAADDECDGQTSVMLQDGTECWE